MFLSRRILVGVQECPWFVIIIYPRRILILISFSQDFAWLESCCSPWLSVFQRNFYCNTWSFSIHHRYRQGLSPWKRCANIYVFSFIFSLRWWPHLLCRQGWLWKWNICYLMGRQSLRLDYLENMDFSIFCCLFRSVEQCGLIARQVDFWSWPLLFQLTHYWMLFEF